MADEVGRLEVVLDARISQFEAKVKRAEDRMRRSTSRMNRNAQKTSRIFDGMTRRLGALATVAGAATLVRGFDRIISKLDEIGKTADRLGVTTDALQEMRGAAEQSGVAVGTLDMALQRFGRRIAEARQGAGEAQGVIEEMGIALTDSDGQARDMTDVLADVADYMAGMESATDRNRIAMKLFDSEGVALVNMLKDGSEGMERMMRKTREMSGVFDKDAIDAAQDLRTELDLLSTAIGNNFVKAMAPAIEALNEFFNVGNRGRIAEVKEEIEALTDLIENGPRNPVTGGLPGQAVIDRFNERLPELRARLATLKSEMAMLGDSSMLNLPEPTGETSTGSGLGSGSGGASGVSFAEAKDRLIEMTAALRNQAAALDMSETEAAEFRAELEAYGIRVEDGSKLTAEQIQTLGELREKYIGAAVGLAEMEEAQRAATEAQREAERAAAEQKRQIEGLITGFSQAAQSADSFEDALRNIGIQMAELAIKGAFTGEGLFGALQPIASTLIGGAVAGAGAGVPPPTGDAAVAGFLRGGLYAKGGAFADGREITAFAKGGVVSQPTVFPMARGAGLMGEAGPEAVMPLKRGPGGRLGVEASGGGGAPVISQTLTFNGVGQETVGLIRREIARNNQNLPRLVQEGMTRS